MESAEDVNPLMRLSELMSLLPEPTTPSPKTCLPAQARSDKIVLNSFEESCRMTLISFVIFSIFLKTFIFCDCDTCDCSRSFGESNPISFEVKASSFASIITKLFVAASDSESDCFIDSLTSMSFLGISSCTDTFDVVLLLAPFSLLSKLDSIGCCFDWTLFLSEISFFAIVFSSFVGSTLLVAASDSESGCLFDSLTSMSVLSITS